VALGLLVATLALVGALVWQAISAMRARDALTEAVLQDYADLAAGVYAQRITAELQLYALEPALQPLGVAPNAPLPAPAPLEIWTNPETKLTIPLVRTYFRLAPGAPDLELSGEALSQAVRAAIADTLRRTLLRSDKVAWTSAPLWIRGPDDSLHALVYRSPRTDDATKAISGFTASFDALRTYFDYSFAIGPLVPAPLTRGAPDDSIASIELRTADGTEIYRSPWLHRSRWRKTRDLGPRWGHLEVRATLAPDATKHIIRPGPPVAQVGLLVGLGVVCTILIVISILQIHRENRFARLRSDFVFSVSHELRTPLAQIRLFAETLRLGRVRDATERERALAIVNEEAIRLTHLVENILTFSRAERRTLTLAPTPIDLAPFLREIADVFAPLAEAREARIETDLAEGLFAFADRDAMRQMVLNLLDNAVKHGPEGQTIRLSSRACDTGLDIAVEDEGPGIAVRDRSRVWNRFVRLTPREGVAAPGTGIGLSVVRELAERHEGSVRIDDGARGARFVIRLPRDGTGERP
jgi:signal transduction histidine kinase